MTMFTLMLTFDLWLDSYTVDVYIDSVVYVKKDINFKLQMLKLHMWVWGEVGWGGVGTYLLTYQSYSRLYVMQAVCDVVCMT